jgi:hypothetical protein
MSVEGRSRLTLYGRTDSRPGHGFADLDFTETPSQGRIQDSGFSPFREFSLGFQERRMQTGHIGPTMMIRVVQHQHGGTFPGLVWDPGITLFDSSTTIREESTDFDFPEFTFGRLRSGFLEEWSSEELTEFMQLMISWLIRSSQVDSCISTLQTSAMSRGCFTSYRLVWDPGDFTIYGVLVFTWRDFAG